MLLSNQELETAFKSEHVRVCLSDHAPEGQQVIRIRKKFHTACWSWTPPHSIYIGDRVLHNPNLKTGLPKTQQTAYVQALYRHEVGHARFTEKDLVKVSKELREMKCPFSLLNLFEDARIEHLMRQDFGRFNWLEFENCTQVTSTSANKSAVSLFFSLIQAEGDEDALHETVKQHLDYQEVLEFYIRSLEVEGTRELYPLLLEWIERFGAPPEDANSDLAQGAALQNDPKLKAEADGGDAPGVTPATSSDFLAHVDLKTASDVAKRLQPLFKSNIGKVGTRTPNGGRFSSRHESAGRAPFRKKEIQTRSKLNIELFIDCSGSMGGVPIDNARTLIAALSLLAQSGHVEGNVSLCGSNPLRTFELPMGLPQISSISADRGTEELEPALRQRLSHCVNADLVLLFTDGRITDVPINKGYLHSKGIYTWGLYVGGYTESDALLRYFDKIACRKSITELVDAILSQM